MAIAVTVTAAEGDPPTDSHNASRPLQPSVPLSPLACWGLLAPARLPCEGCGWLAPPCPALPSAVPGASVGEAVGFCGMLST